MSAFRHQRTLRRERRDEPPVSVASLSVKVEPAPVPTEESRAREEALLEAIAAERADSPHAQPSVVPGRPAGRAGLQRYLTVALLALVGLGLYAWRSAQSETTQVPAASAAAQAGQFQAGQVPSE